MDKGRPPRFLVATFDACSISMRRFPDFEAACDYARIQWREGHATIISEQVRQTGDFDVMERIDKYLDQEGNN